MWAYLKATLQNISGDMSQEQIDNGKTLIYKQAPEDQRDIDNAIFLHWVNQNKTFGRGQNIHNSHVWLFVINANQQGALTLKNKLVKYLCFIKFFGRNVTQCGFNAVMEEQYCANVSVGVNFPIKNVNKRPR